MGDRGGGALRTVAHVMQQQVAMSTTIHCYEYVNQPYARVSEALVLGAVGIFQRATSSAAARAASIVSKLKMSAFDIEIAKDVVITVPRVDRSGHAARVATEATELELEWHAEKGASFFPVMHAKLCAYALSSGETQLELVGTYEAPGGGVGVIADRMMGHRIAEATAHRFLEDVAGRLTVELAD
jgi:hypothetical protein